MCSTVLVFAGCAVFTRGIATHTFVLTTWTGNTLSRGTIHCAMLLNVLACSMKKGSVWLKVLLVWFRRLIEHYLNNLTRYNPAHPPKHPSIFHHHLWVQKGLGIWIYGWVIDRWLSTDGALAPHLYPKLEFANQIYFTALKSSLQK